MRVGPAYGVFITMFATLGGSVSLLAIHIWKEAQRVAGEPTVEPDDELDEQLLTLVVPWLKEAFTRADGAHEKTVVQELKQVILEAELTREQVNALISELNRRERPAVLRRERDIMFEKCYKRLAWLAIDAFGFAIILGIFSIAGLELSFWPPDLWDFVLILLSAHMAANLYHGILAFNTANSAHRDLKQLSTRNNSETEAEPLSDGGVEVDSPGDDGGNSTKISIGETADDASGGGETDESFDRK